jgi:hypothetical protein
MRCVAVPDDASDPKNSQDCTAKYEYMPDGSWKSSGACTDTYNGGTYMYENLTDTLCGGRYKGKVVLP